jgi:opacity protein-like surface antigen
VPGSQIYVGVEGDIAAARVKNTHTLSQTYPADFGFTSDTRTGTTEIGTNGSVRLRAGYVVNNAVLLYLTGGAAAAHVKSSYSYSGINTFGTVMTGAGSIDKTVGGYAAGGGVEFVYIPGVKIRIEYQHKAYRSVSYDVPIGIASCLGGSPGGSCTPGLEHNTVTPRFDQLTIGIGFGL